MPSLSGAGTIAIAFHGTLGGFQVDVALALCRRRGITALFGPSGCGKTTVLRCVAGTDAASPWAAVWSMVRCGKMGRLVQAPSPPRGRLRVPGSEPVPASIGRRKSALRGRWAKAAVRRRGRVGFDDAVALLGLLLRCSIGPPATSPAASASVWRSGRQSFSSQPKLLLNGRAALRT